MIIVHHLENSRSQRVIWLLEELGLTYEVKRYERNPDMSAPAELFDVHPLGKSPVVSDGGEVHAESGAIIEALVERHGGGQLAPEPGTEAHGRYRYWMHYAEGSLMPLMVMTLIFTRIPESPMPFFVKPVAKGLCRNVQKQYLRPQVDRHLAFIEQSLADHEWFAGDSLSAADIQMSFPLEAASSRVGLKDRYPAIAAWLKRIHDRPAYQRALERGGPYALLDGD